jgi:hypothetical protein
VRTAWLLGLDGRRIAAVTDRRARHSHPGGAQAGAPARAGARHGGRNPSPRPKRIAGDFRPADRFAVAPAGPERLAPPTRQEIVVD